MKAIIEIDCEGDKCLMCKHKTANLMNELGCYVFNKYTPRRHPECIQATKEYEELKLKLDKAIERIKELENDVQGYVEELAGEDL